MHAYIRVMVGYLITGLLVGMSGCDDASPERAAPTVEISVPEVESTAPEDARCRLATADAMGPDDCPVQGDGDHDGVDDGLDLCPDTTPGIVVDESGCALASTQADPEPG